MVEHILFFFASNYMLLCLRSAIMSCLPCLVQSVYSNCSLLYLTAKTLGLSICSMLIWTPVYVVMFFGVVHVVGGWVYTHCSGSMAHTLPQAPVHRNWDNDIKWQLNSQGRVHKTFKISLKTKLKLNNPVFTEETKFEV